MLLSWIQCTKEDNSNRNFSIAHWNLNNITTQNFLKLSQKLTIHCITMMVSVFWDMIRLHRTSIGSNDSSLKGYNLHRVDNSDNFKGKVCAYYKETLVIHVWQIKLDQYIFSEITCKNKKKTHVISLYRSPSPTQDQFDNFLWGTIARYF